jgi:hypothetical protein
VKHNELVCRCRAEVPLFVQEPFLSEVKREFAKGDYPRIACLDMFVQGGVPRQRLSLLSFKPEASVTLLR